MTVWLENETTETDSASTFDFRIWISIESCMSFPVSSSSVLYVNLVWVRSFSGCVLVSDTSIAPVLVFLYACKSTGVSPTRSKWIQWTPFSCSSKFCNSRAGVNARDFFVVSCSPLFHLLFLRWLVLFCLFCLVKIRCNTSITGHHSHSAWPCWDLSTAEVK